MSNDATSSPFQRIVAKGIFYDEDRMSCVDGRHADTIMIDASIAFWNALLLTCCRSRIPRRSRGCEAIPQASYHNGSLIWKHRGLPSIASSVYRSSILSNCDSKITRHGMERLPAVLDCCQERHKDACLTSSSGTHLTTHTHAQTSNSIPTIYPR